MPLSRCLAELRTLWFPHMTDSGLDRLTDLLEQGSPLLVHGCFTKAMPMGCLATHVAWHHHVGSAGASCARAGTADSSNTRLNRITVRFIPMTSDSIRIDPRNNTKSHDREG